MNLFESIRNCFKQYAEFRGRASRREFWYFFLFVSLVSSTAALINSYFGIVVMLSLIVPLAAVGSRRLHEIGKSGFWLFIAFLPIAGEILLAYWLAQPAVCNNVNNNTDSSTNGGYYVKCLQGPMQGQSYFLHNNSLYFGRTDQCHIAFPTGTPGVSQTHCVITEQDGAAYITDLGSTYGTFFQNGTKLCPERPEPIQSGTQFYLGSPQNLFLLMKIA